jgi:hypothetical protein
MQAAAGTMLNVIKLRDDAPLPERGGAEKPRRTPETQQQSKVSQNGWLDGGSIW